MSNANARQWFLDEVAKARMPWALDADIVRAATRAITAAVLAKGEMDAARAAEGDYGSTAGEIFEWLRAHAADVPAPPKEKP